MKLGTSKRHSSSIGFAAGLFGVTLITQLFHGFNLSYWTETGMVTMMWATVCKIIFVVVDSVDDILAGILSEHTKSKWGKRIPWLVFGCVWVPIFVILTYAVNLYSGFSSVGFVVYYIIISIFVENANTIFYTNYNSLYPTLFTTTASRNKTATYKHILEILAMAACYFFTPILVDNLGLSYYMVGIIYGVVFLLCVFIMIRSIKVEDDVKAQIATPVKYSFKKMFKEMMGNKAFVIYNIAQSFSIAIFAIIVSLYPMYCKYVLGVSGWQQSIVFMCLFATLFISIPIWSKLISKFGFVKIWLISYILLSVSMFLLYFADNFVSGCIACALIGPMYGGVLLTPDMILAEIIDIDRLKYHVSREAALGSMGTFLSRTSVIIAAIVTASLTASFGYQSGINPGPNPALAFRVTFGIMLAVIGLLGTLFAWLYVKISKKDRMLLHNLKRIDSNKTTEVNISEIINETRSK